MIGERSIVSVVAPIATAIRPILFETPVALASAYSYVHDEPFSQLTPADAYSYFVPPSDVARFNLGPGFDRENVRQRIREITLGELDGAVEPRYFRIVDAQRGIIQFGPAPADFSSIPDSYTGDFLPQPVSALEKALGAKRLPEGIRAKLVNHRFLGLSDIEDEECDTYLLTDIFSLFGALVASGADPSLEINPDYTSEIINERRLFYGTLCATFLSADKKVALKFSAGQIEWREHQTILRGALEFFSGGFARLPGPYFPSVNTAKNADFFVEARLTRDDDHNTLDGHEVLREGFEEIFERIFTDSEKHFFELFVREGLLRLGYVDHGTPKRDEQCFTEGLRAALRAFGMDESGRYDFGRAGRNSPPLP